MSDEGDAANDAAPDGGDTEDGRGRTAVVTEPVTRPLRPTGKRSRQRVADTDEDVDVESPDEVEVTKEDKAKIFGLNAAKIYGVDVKVKRNPLSPDIINKARASYDKTGMLRENAAYGWVRADD